MNNCLNNNYLIIKLASFQFLKIIPMSGPYIRDHNTGRLSH